MVIIGHRKVVKGDKMSILDGLKNFLLFVNDNWTVIIICIALIIAIVKKTKKFFSKSNDEKVKIAKKQIAETMLKMVTDAEFTYEEWTKAGDIKRSQVIEEIYQKYPVLSKVAAQEELTKWIDTTINEALKTMRGVFAENTKTTEVAEGETNNGD